MPSYFIDKFAKYRCPICFSKDGDGKQLQNYDLKTPCSKHKSHWTEGDYNSAQHIAVSHLLDLRNISFKEYKGKTPKCPSCGGPKEAIPTFLCNHCAGKRIYHSSMAFREAPLMSAWYHNVWLQMFTLKFQPLPEENEVHDC